MNSVLDKYTAYILCGGKSSRFGTDKALVKMNNKTLVEIIAGELKKVFDKTVLVTAKTDEYSFLNLECINDVYLNCGPLAGIHAALKHSGTEKNFIISCDMPLMSGEVIKYIADYKTDKHIIIPNAGDKKHYLCAVYGKSILPDVEALLKQTKDMEKCASPYDLINITGYELIDFDALPIFDKKCFYNLNTINDYKTIIYNYQK
jgi:molybdopterin-guanine dinucleotide biosynthesis protein A